MKRINFDPYLPMVGVIGLIVLWYVAVWCRFVDPVLLPSASAMFPLFLVLFGVGDATKISVAAFGAALVILFNVAYGVMNARKTRLLAARVMGASRLRVLWDVMLLEL